MMIEDEEIIRLFGITKAILIIDDEKFARIMLRKALQPITVIEASNGEDGIRKYMDNPDIALIFCDFSMPMMDGIAVLKAIRCGIYGVPHDIPVIMLTGYNDARLSSIAFSLDVDSFISKPISHGAVADALRTVILESRNIMPKNHYARINISGVSSVRNSEPINTMLEPYGVITECSVPINDIEVGYILSRDICTTKGAILAGAGMVLTDRMVIRLRELHVNGVIGNIVWVEGAADEYNI